MKTDKYKNRQFVIKGAIILTVLIFSVQLFFLQIFNEDYRTFADNNAFLKKTIYPSRGLITDRTGKIIVSNKPSYDVMLVMKEMKNFDTLEFCKTLKIDREFFDERIAEIKNRRINRGYSPYSPQLFASMLSIEEYGLLQEKLYKFSGVYIQSRTLREYAYPVAAQVLGNVGEVNKRMIENDTTNYYIPGDYAGLNGLEEQYEKLLRGEKGYEIFLRNSFGKVVERYENGIYDKEAIKGNDVQISLDIELQEYGEYLLQNKIGSVVAIEPSTGEILAAVSAPSFSPSLLVGAERAENFKALNQDKTTLPLLNRAFMGRYAPGSTFKTLNAMIFQQEGIISSSTRYPCRMGYTVGRFHLGCHSHSSPLNLPQSVQHSCNAYYCYAFRSLLDADKYDNIDTSFEVWKNHVVSFGFGYKLGVDIPSENQGFIPNSKTYRRIYGNYWKSLNIVSLSIGQGEILATPVQIANLSAAIANRGYWVVPHFFKSTDNDSVAFNFEKRETSVEKWCFEPIIEGMEMAVNGAEGSTARIAKIEDIVVCGKTGTAQNPHGEDHSLFMAFAPKDDPKIAIAVVVENAGFGATWAAPIGSLMIEKYLKREISPKRAWVESHITNADFISKNVKED